MKRTITVIVLCFYTCVAYASQADSLVWWNPEQSKFPVIEGRGWQGNEVIEPYQRLPKKARQTVRSQVWALSQNATGLIIRFKTNAKQFTVHYTVKSALNMPHFSSTGKSGLDLYSVNRDGGWNWVPGKYAFGDKVGDTITYDYSISADDASYKKGREYLLYLPIYNTVGWLKIGVPKSAIFTPLPARAEKPIAIYGTSITQGACASRPGMAWTSIMGRKLDWPVINLGFSGNGTLDDSMINLINEIDAKVFVLDCLGNMLERQKFSTDEVRKRIIESVKSIRTHHPSTPILLPAFTAFNEDWLAQNRRLAIKEQNTVMEGAYHDLVKSGIKNLYLLPASEMIMGMDHTTDYGHPNDIGLMQYAEAFEKAIRKILQQYPGDNTTARPVTQYRNDTQYDWWQRHQDIIKQNRQSPPENVLIGSSIAAQWPITHFKNAFIPDKVTNLGFTGDRLENILWRVNHGELEGYTAKKIIIMQGSENLSLNTDAEIIEGTETLIRAIKLQQPNASLFITGIQLQTGQEKRIQILNMKISNIASKQKIKYVDLGK